MISIEELFFYHFMEEQEKKQKEEDAREMEESDKPARASDYID